MLVLTKRWLSFVFLTRRNAKWASTWRRMACLALPCCRPNACTTSMSAAQRMCGNYLCDTRHTISLRVTLFFCVFTLCLTAIFALFFRSLKPAELAKLKAWFMCPHTTSSSMGRSEGHYSVVLYTADCIWCILAVTVLTFHPSISTSLSATFHSRIKQSHS